MICRALCVLLFLGLTAERDGDTLLYSGLWRSPLSFFSPLFDSIPVVRQAPWNLILLALAPFALLQPSAWRRRAWPMDAAMGLSLLTILLGLVWGLARGGDAHLAYYQVSPLVTAAILGLVFTSSVQSLRDLKALAFTIVAAALVRSGLALYFFVRFVQGREPYPPCMTSHDDSPLFAIGVVSMLAWAISRGTPKSWAWAAATIVPMLLAMNVNTRRIVWFELLIALGYFYLLLPRSRAKRRVNRALLVAVPVLVLYVAVGWGRQGALFAPLQALQSATGDEDLSTLSRNEENLNLVITYLPHPILGSGWGHPYTMVSSYFANFSGDFGLMFRYLPHNSLAGLVAFTGLVGLFGTLMLLPVSAFLAARTCRATDHPFIRAAAISAFCMAPIYGIHAFGDLGLQSFTPNLLLGAALGATGRIAAWSGAWPTRSRARRRRPEEADAGEASAPGGEPAQGRLSRADAWTP